MVRTRARRRGTRRAAPQLPPGKLRLSLTPLHFRQAGSVRVLSAAPQAWEALGAWRAQGRCEALLSCPSALVVSLRPCSGLAHALHRRPEPAGRCGRRHARTRRSRGPKRQALARPARSASAPSPWPPTSCCPTKSAGRTGCHRWARRCVCCRRGATRAQTQFA